MSNVKKVVVPYPLGMAEDTARQLVEWAFPGLQPEVAEIESSQLCHGVLLVTVTYAPKAVVQMLLFDRAVLLNATNQWELVEAVVKYRQKTTRITHFMMCGILPSMKVRLRKCSDPVQGEIAVLCNTETGKACIRLNREIRREKGIRVVRFPFQCINHYRIAQEAAKECVAIFEGRRRLRSHRTGMKAGGIFGPSMFDDAK